MRRATGSPGNSEPPLLPLIFLLCGLSSSDPVHTSLTGAVVQEQGELPHGEARAAYLVEALERAAESTLGPLIQEGFDELLLEVKAFRGASAKALAEALHRRAGAVWSAMSLALISTQTGDSDRATEVLRSAIEGASDPREEYDLLERLGLALQGSGQERRALAPLGSAFARGSVNAGVVLGRIALREGRLRQARAIFRTLLDEDPPPSWALRGWGLAMLPGSPPSTGGER